MYPFDIAAWSAGNNIGRTINEHVKNGWLSCVTNFCFGNLKAVGSATVPSVVCRSHSMKKKLDLADAAAKRSVMAAIMPIKYVNVDL